MFKWFEVCQLILINEDFEKICVIGDIVDNQFLVKMFDIIYSVDKGVEGMEYVLDELCEWVEWVVWDGYNIIIFFDCLISCIWIVILVFLVIVVVYYYLICKGLWIFVGFVVEIGEVCEVYYFCVLVGFGVEVINFYLVFEIFLFMYMEMDFFEEVDKVEVVVWYIKLIDKGILKVMFKMGILIYQFYCGVQIFDVVGLVFGFVDKYFFGMVMMIEGIGFLEVF